MGYHLLTQTSLPPAPRPTASLGPLPCLPFPGKGHPVGIDEVLLAILPGPVVAPDHSGLGKEGPKDLIISLLGHPWGVVSPEKVALITEPGSHMKAEVRLHGVEATQRCQGPRGALTLWLPAPPSCWEMLETGVCENEGWEGENGAAEQKPFPGLLLKWEIFHSIEKLFNFHAAFLTVRLACPCRLAWERHTAPAVASTPHCGGSASHSPGWPGKRGCELLSEGWDRKSPPRNTGQLLVDTSPSSPRALEEQ